MVLFRGFRQYTNLYLCKTVIFIKVFLSVEFESKTIIILNLSIFCYLEILMG